jgi:hypothetical protein
MLTQLELITDGVAIIDATNGPVQYLLLPTAVKPGHTLHAMRIDATTNGVDVVAPAGQSPPASSDAFAGGVTSIALAPNSSLYVKRPNIPGQPLITFFGGSAPSAGGAIPHLITVAGSPIAMALPSALGGDGQKHSYLVKQDTVGQLITWASGTPGFRGVQDDLPGLCDPNTWSTLEFMFHQADGCLYLTNYILGRHI